MIKKVRNTVPWTYIIGDLNDEDVVEICLIMEQKQILKNATPVDTLDSAKKIGLSKLKSHVDKLDKDKFKHVPNGFSSSKSKVDNLNFGKLETTPVDLSKLRNVVKIMSLRRPNMINWLKN